MDTYEDKSVNPVRSRDIRESNEKLILRLIREGNGISQSEVVGLTGLRAPTVLRFFNHLTEQGFIRRVDREHDKDRRGRKPVYFEPIPESAYALGMEFWAYSASAAILDFAGHVVFSRSWTLDPGNRSDVLVLLRSMYREALDDSGIPEDKLLGLCVAAPGQVDVETGELVQYSRMGIADINLGETLEAEFGLPVIVQNNSAAVAWEEYKRGIGKDVRSLFTVMIRAGVGGAFLDDGDIFVTKTHTTLEIGHIAVEYDGRLCDCGSRGCLETYLSEGAILKDLQPAARLESIEDLDSLLAEGREDVELILNEKAGVLAQAVRNLISLFGPEMFIIVTRSPGLGRYLAERVRSEVKSQASARWQGRTVIESALYDPEKAGRGAADLVYKSFFFLAIILTRCKQ
jgi:N-acetylglucosamine repressor